jgi:hypothetical protein
MSNKMQPLTHKQAEIFHTYIQALPSPYDKTAAEIAQDLVNYGIVLTAFQVSKYRNKITGRRAALRKPRSTPTPAPECPPPYPIQTDTAIFVAHTNQPSANCCEPNELVFLGNSDRPKRMEVVGVHGGNVQGYVELTVMSGHTKVAVYSSFVARPRPHDRDIHIGATLIAVLYNPALIKKAE